MEQRHLAVVAAGDDVAPVTRPEPDLELIPSTVRKAIATLYARYAEPMTLAELAAGVFVSPFHFSRIFTKATGVTPGRYLTAIRLFEAKKLLLGTELTVSDVVCSVGYSSVGTFTGRFTRSVGMTPTQFRHPEVGRLLMAVSPGFRRLPSASLPHRADGGGAGTVLGRIAPPPGLPAANLLVGVFPEAIPQCGPVAFVTGTGVRSATDVEITGVPDGDWTVIAVAEHPCGTGKSVFSVGTAPCVVDTRSGVPTGLRLRMRALRPTDPPIAVTLAAPPSPIGQRLPTTRPLRAVA